jgi:hypothetical protein
MSGFAAEWLAMREPHDLRARNKTVLDTVANHFAKHSAISVVDLACGTGSTLRAISSRLPKRQTWRLVDNDLSLLGRIKAPPAKTADIVVTPTPVDLAHDLEAALDGPVDLIAASAFLDLVSAEWLERLAIEAAARGLPLYAALTYDGRITMTPLDPGDDAIVDALNSHQRTDKGFGPALGSTAAASDITQFSHIGYAVKQGAADWLLAPQDTAFQLEFLTGCASAARDRGDMSMNEIVAWLTRRRDSIDAGDSSIEVGHVDLFVYPQD